MTKILIPNAVNYEAVTGETLELHFSIMTLPVVRDWQKQAIIKQLSQDKHYKVISVESYTGTLVITVKIIDNPFPLILLIGSITALLGGWFVWGSISKVYKLIDDPKTRATVNIGLIAISAIVGFLVIKAVR